MVHQFTAIIERDEQTYIARCPGLNLHAIGASITEARDRLADAIAVFMATASPDEIKRRQDVYLTQIEIEEGARSMSARTVSAVANTAEYLHGSRHSVMNCDPSHLPVYRRRPAC